MKKLIVLLFAVFLYSSVSKAQQKDSIPINKDSIEKAIDEFLALIDSSNKPKSYWQLSLGAGNTQFSINNVALNAQQLTKGVTLIPTIAYFDKSGLSLTYNNFLSLNNVNSGIIQHSITPAYDYSFNKAFDFGFSYTRFIGNKEFGSASSPYQNDLYSYVQYNKWKIQPSVSLGYSTGKFSEFSKLDTFTVIQRPFRPDTTIKYIIYDTLRVKLRDFSTIVSAQRQFVFETKKAANYITFTPAVMLFLARNAYDVDYTSASVFTPSTRLFLQNRPQLRDQIIRQIRSSFPALNETRNFLNTTNFQLQSIGLNLDAVFYFNKFYINPQFYFDYYLQGDSDNFTMFYTIHAGFIL
jgi:hypothetical protein